MNTFEAFNFGFNKVKMIKIEDHSEKLGNV